MSLTIDPAELISSGRQSSSDRSDSDVESPADSEVSSVSSHVGSPTRAPSYNSLPTGLVYDVRMRFHAEPIQNVNDTHPEDPRRIFVVYDELRQAGLVYDKWCPDLAGPDLLKRIDARYATKEEVLRLHTEEVWDFVMSLTTMDEDELKTVGDSQDSVYLSVNTPMCAKLAAGGAIEAARAVMNGHVKNSIAVIRPPGHHAEHHKVMGFCFFNNVPVAVRAIQNEYGDTARRIMILDWDVHHGNGVQNMFYDDPNVLYISLHVDQGGAFYPNTEAQNHKHCGEGNGAGRNVNIPWSQTGMADGDYLYAFQQVVMPIAQAFDPDLVFVCAGFDAAEGDHIGGCHVSPAGYAHMTHMLKSLADGKLVVCMEGGYNLRSVAVSALAVTRTLMGEQPGRLTSTEASQTGAATVQMVLRQQAKYWPCLHMYDAQQTAEAVGTDRMNVVIREWQASYLYRDHNMMPLFIARDRLNMKYDHEVLATPNFRQNRPLLLIFHDPPDVIGGSYDKDGNLEPQNTFMNDPIRSYIDFAIAHGFGVIDVNLPFPDPDPDQEPNTNSSSTAEKARKEDSDLLATYVWENYIELSETQEIYIIGIGSAYESILTLLKRHEARFVALVRKLFFFICDNKLVSVNSGGSNNVNSTSINNGSGSGNGAPSTKELLDWYFGNARLYISERHSAVTEGLVVLKQRRKYGFCIASPERRGSGMLRMHRGEVCGLLKELTAAWRAETGFVVLDQKKEDGEEDGDDEDENEDDEDDEDGDEDVSMDGRDSEPSQDLKSSILVP